MSVADIPREPERVRLIKPSPSITVSTAAKAMKAAGKPVIDLSLGEPDFDTPDHIAQAAHDAALRGETRYTAPDGTPALKEAVADKFRRENGLAVTRDNITCSNGAKQVLFNALMTTLDPGDEVICPAPYWVSYTDMVLLLGGVPRIVECGLEAGYKLTPDALAAALTEKSRWLMLNSPSNPTGAVYTRNELVALGEVIARHHRLMVMADEIYEHILFEGDPFSSFTAACPDLAYRTLVVNGVSKAYAMTGWRIGYGAGPDWLVRRMAKVQSQSTGNPCSIAQAAAVAALTGPQDHIARFCAAFRARRDLVVAGLGQIEGVEADRPKGAFYAYPRLAAFIGATAPDGSRMEGDADLAEFVLREALVAGVPGAAFGLSPHLRLSFAASKADLQEAIGRLGAALGRLCRSG